MSISLKNNTVNLINIAVTAVILLSGSIVAKAQSLSDEVIEEINQAIKDAHLYDNIKISNIERLNSKLSNKHLSLAERYDINRQLFLQYESFVCDSALHYINANIEIADSLGREDLFIESSLHKSDVLSKAGLFSESLAILNSLRQDTLPAPVLSDYYRIYSDTYQYMSEYVAGTEYHPVYTGLVKLYRDSALSVTDRHSFAYISMYPTSLMDRGKYDEAEEFLKSEIGNFRPGSREYSILASLLAFGRFKNSDIEGQCRYLAESALSDIKGSIKENMALRELGARLYDEGMVDDANKFIKKSMEDASFFSARMRSTQVGQLLPLIDKRYDLMQHEAQTRMRIIIYVLVFVAIIFAAGMFFIVRLTHRLSRTNEKLRLSNEQVGSLNEELQCAADTTKELNVRLHEANKIKETYLRQFMEMSSRSINNLEHFRKAMYILLTTGKTEELRKSLKSNTPVADSLKELYMTFDKAFLTIFPNFVESFNLLLREEERLELRAGEPFSTEMRIYALIRMGITDNHRIADFLRCSLSTIYTYRSKMKARAIDQEAFEDAILSITAIER